MNEFCYYHPQTMAKEVCERCKNSICENDTRIYRQINYKSDGESSYYTYHNYCILCNADQLKQDNTRNGTILIIIVTILALIGLRYGSLIFLIIIIFLTILGFGFYYYRFQPAKLADLEAINFRNNLSTKYNKSNSLFCRNCGQKVLFEDKFCNNCGNAT